MVCVGFGVCSVVLWVPEFLQCWCSCSDVSCLWSVLFCLNCSSSAQDLFHLCLRSPVCVFAGLLCSFLPGFCSTVSEKTFTCWITPACPSPASGHSCTPQSWHVGDDSKPIGDWWWAVSDGGAGCQTGQAGLNTRWWFAGNFWQTIFNSYLQQSISCTSREVGGIES